MLKATIIENSLADKSILQKVKIEKTYQTASWTLHNVWVEPQLIPELSQSLADGPWYIHLWKPGQDDVTVVFKDKVIPLKYSDKSTWQPAIDFGISIGIPKEQLDFPID